MHDVNLMWRNFETVRRWGKENGEKKTSFVSRGEIFRYGWVILKKCEGKIIKTLMDFDLK